MTEPTPTPTAVPPAPRTMTPGARRAAWTHAHVRFWWLVAGVLLVAMAYLLVVQTMEWTKDARLVESGAPVEATVFEAGVKLKNRPISPLASVDLTYKYNGQDYKVTGELPERRGDLLNGQTLPIRVDPNDPKVWTNRTTPPALSGYLTPPLLLLPPLALAAGAALLSRQRVAGIWANGEAQQAIVVDTKQTPLAPLSQAVRCTLTGGRDKRLITVFVPQSAGKVAKGETLWIVTHPKNPQRALAASAFLH